MLGDAVNFARMAQVSAERVTTTLTGKPGTDPLLPLNEPAVIGDPNPPRLE